MVPDGAGKVEPQAAPALTCGMPVPPGNPMPVPLPRLELQPPDVRTQTAGTVPPPVVQSIDVRPSVALAIVPTAVPHFELSVVTVAMQPPPPPGGGMTFACALADSSIVATNARTADESHLILLPPLVELDNGKPSGSEAFDTGIAQQSRLRLHVLRVGSGRMMLVTD